MARPDRFAPDRLAVALAELGVRTASLMHELRQPLFAAKGRLQRALGQGHGLSVADVAEILEEIAFMEELIQYYAPDVTGAPPLSPASTRSFDLRVPTRRALSMVALRAEAIGADVRVDLPENPVTIAGREMAVRQVALNLLQNALDAIANAAERTIDVRVALDARQASLEVRDSGPGLPESLRTRLFEPFVSTKDAHDGVGLGLFIAQKLVSEAEGTLVLDTPEGGGTRARVLLPAA